MFLSLGCDVLGGAGDSPTPPPANAEDAEPTKAAAGNDQTAPAVKKVQAAAIESVVAEAKQAAGKSAADPQLPITLTDLRIATETSDEVTSMEVTVDSAVNREIWEGTELWVKGRCKTGDAVVVEADSASPVGGPELTERKTGDASLMNVSFSALGITDETERCELSFALAGRSGGPSIDVGRGCWEAGEAKLGACEQSLLGAAASGFSSPVEITNVGVGPDNGYSSFEFQYALKANETLDDDDRVRTVAACVIGSKRYVQTTEDRRFWGPFRVEAGETTSTTARGLWSEVQGERWPKECDLTVLHVAEAKPAAVVLRRSCLRGTVMSEGRCDGGAVATGTPGPVTATSLSISAPEVTLDSHYSRAGEYTMSLSLDLDANDFLDAGAELQAQADCRVGRLGLRDTSSLSLPAEVLPGETHRVDTRFFYSPTLEANPSRCQIDLSVESSGKREVLYSLCYTGGSTKRGAC